MMTLDHYFDQLHDLIYQIPSSKHGWETFAKQLLQVLNASYVHIQAIDFRYQVVSFSNGVGPLPLENYANAELAYLRLPIESDPRWGKFLETDRQGWYQCHSHVSEEFVQQSELYQKILLPIHCRYVATHTLIRTEDVCVFWSVSTSEQRQPLHDHELKFLDQLTPHLQNVIAKQGQHFEFSADHIVGYGLIDRLVQPIILLNLAGQVVHCNHAARQFLQTYEFLKMEHLKLVFNEPQQQQFLQYLYDIENAFRYDQSRVDELQEQHVYFEFNTHQKISIKISVLASDKEKSFFGIRPLVMLKFYPCNAKLDIQLSEQELNLFYQLSKREVEICQLFVNGLKFQDIAQSTNTTLSTVRTYFKKIFLKTNCTSQTELMKLLIGMSL